MERLGGWKESELAEDLELSLRMLEHGYMVRYADNVVSMQEAPSSLRSFFTQRSRWYRGYIENAFKYGSLLKRFGKRVMDAELLLFGPLIMALSLVGYFFGLFGLIFPTIFSSAFPLVLTINVLSLFSVILVFLFVGGFSLEKLILAVSIYFYWILLSGVAFKCFIDFIFRRRLDWVKTDKTGSVDADKRMMLEFKVY